MKHFEYKTYKMKNKASNWTKELNALGNRGWQLVYVEENNRTKVGIFVREIFSLSLEVDHV